MLDETESPKPASPPLNVISDWTIASAAINIMKELSAEKNSVLMSKLGQILSARLGSPLRQVLGERRLRTIMENVAGQSLEFEGAGQTLSVRLVAPTEGAPSGLRYDSRFWAAFAKPVAENKQRFIRLQRPFDFDDVEITEEIAQNEDDRRIIDARYVPSADIPKPERDSIIRKSIDMWCEENRISQSHFLLAAPRSRMPHNTAQAEAREETFNTLAVRALIALIESTNVEKRRNLALSYSDLLDILKK